MSKVFNMVGGGGGKNISSIIITGLQSTDTITCTKDGRSYTATWDSTAQYWEIIGLPLGTFTVTATNGTSTTTETVLIDVSGVYGVEMNYKLWLYKDGDECTAVTGGWNVTYLRSSSYSTVAKNSDNIYMKNIQNNDYQPYMSTKLKIDTSRYSKLCLVADAYRYSSNSNSYGMVTIELKSTNTRDSYYDGNAMGITANVTYTDKEFSWNLSSENNYLLIGVTMVHPNGWAELKVKKVWLE